MLLAEVLRRDAAAILEDWRLGRSRRPAGEVDPPSANLTPLAPALEEIRAGEPAASLEQLASLRDCVIERWLSSQRAAASAVDESTHDLAILARDLRALLAALDEQVFAVRERERVRAEEARRSRDALEQLVAAAPIALCAVDRSRVVRVANPRAAQLLGAREGAPLALVPATTGPFPLERALEGETVHGLVASPGGSGPDDLAVDVALAAAPIAPPGTGAVIVARSVLEHERSASERDRFLAMLAHELRTPLAAVALQASLASRAKTLGEARALTKKVRATTRRLGRMVDDLLDLARFHARRAPELQPSAVDLHAIVRSSLDELAGVATRNPVHLSQRGDTRGEWDGDRLKQVVLNLVANAAAASPEGAPIDVLVAEGERDSVELVVADRGQGIPRERLARLFEPFGRRHAGHARVRSTSGVLGLGLFIVDFVVRAHGGTVTAESEETRGTTMRVRLPRSCSTARAGSEAS